MARSLLPFTVADSPAGLPLFQRIAESIAGEIRRGRLAPGSRLPSSRGLAEMLSVHRNTALAAYGELERQGYVTTSPARGTFVQSTLPERSARKLRRKSGAAPVTFDLPPLSPHSPFQPLPRGTLALLGGLPDLRHVPVAEWTRAYRAELRRNVTALDYGSEYGDPRLLSVLGTYLAETRGVVPGEGELLVTRGSQLGLHLAARALVRPGAVLAVEAFGYPPAWEGFRLAGARLCAVEVDRQGIVPSKVEALAQQGNLAAVYLTPHHQYPTTATLSAGRRLELLALAERYRFAVIEDDYDHEYHFEGRPVLPLASADPARVVVHVGTFSKVLAPGLRVGYVVAQSSIIERMARHRTYLDRQGDHASERALASLIEDGVLSSHIRRMHRIYSARRAHFFEVLTRDLGDVLRFDEPKGGLALWARVQGRISPALWAEAAQGRDLLLQAGRRFSFEGRPVPYFRLGFARHDESELSEAVKRMKAALAELCREPRALPKASAFSGR